MAAAISSRPVVSRQVPTQSTLPPKASKVTVAFQKANASQFLSHIRIPEKKCITHHDMLLGTKLTAFALFIASFFLASMLVTIPPLALFFMITIYSVVLILLYASLFYTPDSYAETLDLEKPQVFKNVLEDLRTLSLKRLCEKYKRYKKGSEFDYLCSKGVIDEATKEKMNAFQKRFEKLQSEYFIALKDAIKALVKGTESQTRTSHKTTPAEIFKRTEAAYIALEAEFNRYRNTPQKA